MEPNAVFKAALLAVRDVEASKRFYCELLGQTVETDLGWNVTMSGGFVLQQEFAWLCDIPRESVVERSHNMELYFEVEDFDAFLEVLSRHPEVELLHPPKTHEWKQRVVRIYDLDHHIIEIGESMAVIARRYLAQGCTVAETAELIQHPVRFVEAVQAGLL